MMHLYVDVQDGGEHHGEVVLLEKLFAYAIDQLGSLQGNPLPDQVELSLTFVHDEDIRRLNREYRDVDAITDVLSFPLREEYDSIMSLGDIVINTQRLKEQAEEYGHGYRRELMYLAIHSLLHLYGYDHEHLEDKKKMRATEERLLEGFQKEDEGI